MWGPLSDMLNLKIHCTVCSLLKSEQLTMYLSLTHSSTDVDKVNDYIQIVDETISHFFNNRRVNFTTLSDSTESVATWITMNVRHLQHPDKVWTSQIIAESFLSQQYPSTTGVLYLGLASVQMSHMTHSKSHSFPSLSLTQLNLYGRQYSIYSDTRWCSGTDEVWRIIATDNIGVGF